MPLSRRTLLKLAGLAGLKGFQIIGANATYAQEAPGEKKWLHGLSLFGELKYPPNFPHFDYVNPNAPKGGKLRLYAIGSFDSLNPYTYKGDSTTLAATNEALFTSALDEPSTEYGLIAEAVARSDDFSWVSYRLRPQARFYDGQPMSVEDVIWSMDMLKKVNPFYNAYYKNVTRAEQSGEREVTFVFSQKGNRELPQIVGQLPVLPKHWWTGQNAKGKPRDIAETTLEIPLGSSSYKCVEVKAGTFIRLQRMPDYWGKDLPVNLGQDNFDEIAYDFYLDMNVAFEAFKADRYDVRFENTAKNWATGYDFPAVQQKKVILEKIQTKTAEPMQCFVLNLRKAKYQDARVRLAFNYAFDFEWSNTNLFYGAYTRTASFFANSELAATGLPSAEELVFLNEIKDKIPPEVFTQEFKNPTSGDRTQRRNNLRTAAQLLNDAGWTQQKQGSGTVLKNSLGEVLAAEIILDDPSLERIVIPYTEELRKLGIQAIVRPLDSAQYQRRLQEFDFDVIWTSFSQSLSPGNEQREFWGSEAADRKGSRNYAGIKNPAIDHLIERLIFANSRAELVAATKALDRVLLWNDYVVPMWHVPYERVARWDRFGRPEKLPDYSTGFPSIWWWDEERAQKLGRGT
jgi:microcin C transport system substrate-binding protein